MSRRLLMTLAPISLDPSLIHPELVSFKMATTVADMLESKSVDTALESTPVTQAVPGAKVDPW